MKLPLILAGGLAALAVFALGNTVLEANRRATVTPITRPVVNAESPHPATSPPPSGPFAVYTPPPGQPAPPPAPAPPPPAPAPPPAGGGDDD